MQSSDYTLIGILISLILIVGCPTIITNNVQVGYYSHEMQSINISGTFTTQNTYLPVFGIAMDANCTIHNAVFMVEGKNYTMTKRDTISADLNTTYPLILFWADSKWVGFDHRTVNTSASGNFVGRVNFTCNETNFYNLILFATGYAGKATPTTIVWNGMNSTGAYIFENTNPSLEITGGQANNSVLSQPYVYINATYMGGALNMTEKTNNTMIFTPYGNYSLTSRFTFANTSRNNFCNYSVWDGKVYEFFNIAIFWSNDTTSCNYTSGKWDDGYELNGVDQYFTSGMMSFESNERWTGCAWIKPRRKDYEQQTIFSSLNNTGNIFLWKNGFEAYYVLNETTNYLGFFTVGNVVSNNDQIYGGSLTVDEWNHVCFTYDGLAKSNTSMKIWVNGERQEVINLSDTLSIHDITPQFQKIIGARGYFPKTTGYPLNVSYAMKGGIDNVAFFNKNLTETEIKMEMATNWKSLNSTWYVMEANYTINQFEDVNATTTVCDIEKVCLTRDNYYYKVGCVFDYNCIAELNCLNNICRNLSNSWMLKAMGREGNISIDKTEGNIILKGKALQESTTCNGSRKIGNKIYLNSTYDLCTEGIITEGYSGDFSECTGMRISNRTFGNYKICMDYTTGNIYMRGYLDEYASVFH